MITVKLSLVILVVNSLHLLMVIGLAMVMKPLSVIVMLVIG